MGFGAGSLRGADGRGGTVDHRFARRQLLSEYRKGRLAKHQVCDAHPELLRAAAAIGTPTSVDCPICEEDRLVLVTYVFGPRMPPFGRCISSKRELDALDRRADPLAAYIVEVCRQCSWHHLLQVVPIGGRAKARAGG